MAGAKFYYNLSDSLGEVAAKTAADTVITGNNGYTSTIKFTTPKDVFTIHNYYADTEANYEYITPTTLTPYGGWASYDYHAIAQDKFYYKNSSSSAYTSFKFVHKLSAPLFKKITRDTNWGRCQSPFACFSMGNMYMEFGAKIYWDNANSTIKIDVLDDAGIKQDTKLWDGYGVFILLAGAGGGGGGGDNEYWGQGKPGGGGGGGGGTALIYFDAKKAYDDYPGSYLLISIGLGGAGGKGGSGFTDGSDGGNSFAELKDRSGTILREIICEGGKGGADHAWDAAADSAGGEGGKVWSYNSDDTDETSSKILCLLDYDNGGKGGAGKRGADGISGNSVTNGSWKIPFKDSWTKLETFSYGSETCYVGRGGEHNWQGGGGGGCATGYKNSEAPIRLCGQGVGGYGGGSNQEGAQGANGYCGIFLNCIPGTPNCNVKKV